MKQQAIYREVQYFRQWWLWLVIGGIVLLSWWAWLQQVIFGQPFGTNPGPDWLVWLLWLLCGLGLPVLFSMFKLLIEVYPDQVLVQFQPLITRRIPVADIERLQLRTYHPIKEYGGWGIKGWSLDKLAYNARGNQGVELTLRDGRSVMLGSQQAQALADAISSVLG